MSIIFGVRHMCDIAASSTELSALSRATDRWASEGTLIRMLGRVGMGLQPYRTHERSQLADGPVGDAFGNLLSLDGRLDNHASLGAGLDVQDTEASDAAIMLSAFLRWGEGCFARFSGDWAVAVWSEREQALYLARDHAGTRTLYFEQRGEALRWSTYLETLLSVEPGRTLDEQYLYACLIGRSPEQRTPYATISSVKPGHFLKITKEGQAQFAHWAPLPKDKTLRYSKDADYEEHFLEILKQAVARRTGPGAPILAHLSGGMDSSTIVCVSDRLRKDRGDSLLDTLSFYDDTEPSWDERPYFGAVEEARGKIGIHADVSGVRPTFAPPSARERHAPVLPGIDSGIEEQKAQLEQRLVEGGYRAVLSGIGGDELLGGVPTPLPELSDHLVSADLSQLLKRGVTWGLSLRRPLIEILGETLTFSINAYQSPRANLADLPWVLPNFERRRLNDPFLQEERVHFGWTTPSVRVTARTWKVLLDTMPHEQTLTSERREYRFPYLDRDLVDFLLRVPNEQLVRPGQRRSLMRRALRGIVPDVVLDRRRKGYIARSQVETLSNSSRVIHRLMADSFLAREGYIDSKAFTHCLHQAVTGTRSEWSSALIRTCSIELWLSSQRQRTKAA